MKTGEVLLSMKKVLALLLIITTVTIGLPLLLFITFNEKNTTEKESEISQTISVYVKDEDKVCQMEMNQYLKEVVAAEMPAEFYDEALKAQTIAARTYLVNRISAYKKSEIPQCHKGAYICTDSTHCKGWISQEKRKQMWSEDKREEYWEKISNAVDSTKNLIITYNDEPISAVFHSTSSGWTENAKDVWGGEVSYLVSVESEGDKNAPRYETRTQISKDEFMRIAGENIQGEDFKNPLVDEIKRSEAGGIISLRVGGVLVKGTDFRFMYGLRSTNIEIEISDELVTFVVKGYGHGVGMSQYGANYLASVGKNYEDILKTYYTGVEIGEFEGF